MLMACLGYQLHESGINPQQARRLTGSVLYVDEPRGRGGVAIAVEDVRLPDDKAGCRQPIP